MRKGLTLSINVVVMLIISILIFILAISMLWNWYGKAESLKADLDRQTEEQILSALRQGNQLVSLPITVKQITRGDAATFGLGVRNIGPTQTYNVQLSFSGAYTPQGRSNQNVDAQYIEDNWLGQFQTIESITLTPNELRALPVLIKAQNNVQQNIPTPPGDYVFNICVFDGAPQYCSPDLLQSDVLYTNRIYQVTVRI